MFGTVFEDDVWNVVWSTGFVNVDVVEQFFHSLYGNLQWLDRSFGFLGSLRLRGVLSGKN